MPVERLSFQHKTQAPGSLRKWVVPFINTPFSVDLRLYLVLWPVWWALGIEQLLAPFFLAWEAVRLFVRTRGHVFVSTSACLAAGLALWWLVPVARVESDFLDIFLKDTATAWSQVLMLILLWNSLRSARAWHRVVRGLNVLAAYIALGGLIFALGLWRGELLSVIGRLLPASLTQSSAFFESIAWRDLGSVSPGVGEFMPLRLSSFALRPSGLSLMCLLLIPFIGWRVSGSRGWVRLGQALILVGLLVCLVGSGSRIAYFAFAAGCGLYVLLRLRHLLRPKGAVLIIPLAAAILLAVGIGYVGIDAVKDLLDTVLFQVRRGSWGVRLLVYQETLRLLPQYPIAGWGVSQRIPELPSEYSAGTHSDILAMLFQHGMVGLLLYVGLWFSIWRDITRGLRGRAGSPLHRLLWIMVAVGMLSFNIRALAGIWWWDQLLTMTVWTMWGLIMARPRLTIEYTENKLIVGSGTSPGMPRRGVNQQDVGT